MGAKAQSKKLQQSDNSLRVTGGELRGRRMRFPIRPGLRPTLERERERLFNWLQFDLAGRSILDAFAGSGILGLEALSRSAAHCVFVERDTIASQAIQATLKEWRCSERGQVVQADFFGWLAHATEPFDVVFLDPPFSEDLFNQALQAVASAPAVRPGALVYLEAPRSFSGFNMAPFTVEKEKASGQLVQCLLRKQTQSEVL